jgi:group I intron endonuclease
VTGATGLKATNCGIYAITNMLNGKQYIGSSVYFPTRWSHHRKALRRGTHHAIPLQNAWNKYGEEAFTFTILELCSRNALIEREQHWLDTAKPEYNIALVADRPRQGRPWTEEERERIRAKVRGWKPTLEQLARRRKAADELQRGVTMPAETRAKISATKHRWSMPLEARAKLSAARKGLKLGTYSAEHRQHIADGLRGKRKSAAHIEKMRASQTGKKLSEETRAAMSASQKARREHERLERIKKAGTQC